MGAAVDAGRIARRHRPRHHARLDRRRGDPGCGGVAGALERAAVLSIVEPENTKERLSPGRQGPGLFIAGGSAVGRSS